MPSFPAELFTKQGGCSPASRDPRDHLLVRSAHGPLGGDLPVPDVYEWQSRYPMPAKVQRIGICTAAAETAAIQWVEIGEGQSPPTELSELYNFWQQHKLTGNFFGGTCADAMRVAATVGTCEERFMSTSMLIPPPGADESQWQNGILYNGVPSTEADLDARNHRVMEYLLIGYEGSAALINLIKWTLAQGHPIIFGRGNHAMCLFGYNGLGFTGVNSGEFGQLATDRDCFIDYADVAGLFDLWTCVRVNISGIGPAMTPGQLLAPVSISCGWTAVGIAGLSGRTALLNIGESAVNVVSVVSNSPEFVIVANTIGAVASGAFCNIDISFRPTAAGLRSGTVTVTSTGVGSPQSFSVGGTGMAVTPVPTPPVPPPSGNAAILINLIAAQSRREAIINAMGVNVPLMQATIDAGKAINTQMDAWFNQLVADGAAPPVVVPPAPIVPPGVGDLHDPALWYPPFDPISGPHGKGNSPPGFAAPATFPGEFILDPPSGNTYRLIDNAQPGGDGSATITEYTTSGNVPNGIDGTGTRTPRFNITGTPNPNIRDTTHTYAQQKAIALGGTIAPPVPPASTPGTQPAGTTITAGVGTITDSAGNVWRIGAAPKGEQFKNGVATGSWQISGTWNGTSIDWVKQY